jgi:hypothetical protein
VSPNGTPVRLPPTTVQVGRPDISIGRRRLKGFIRSFVNRLLRLTLLAPDIVEAILDGRQSKGMQLKELTGTIPSDWGEQRDVLLSGAA